MIEINDFKKIEDVPQEVIEKYESVISDKVIEFWKRYGLGTFFDGFMKSINPEEYTDLMGYGTQFYKEAIPLFVTGLGDIIYVEKEDEFMGILKFRYKSTTM
ncbi:GAD-like domain-containing protein, partial [Stenotrophomonas bentonitica]|uniref:GAD-like domain-containing protein n=1 Tax=Stenotrophomonas bentonitica TaxID=1450134 RepID=UPI0037D2A425